MYVEYEVLMIVHMKSNVIQYGESLMLLRNISTPSSQMKSKPNEKSAEASYKLAICFCSFNREDGGPIFLRNVKFFLKYTALQPRKLYSSWFECTFASKFSGFPSWKISCPPGKLAGGTQ
jgi:hypothetical protein